MDLGQHARAPSVITLIHIHHSHSTGLGKIPHAFKRQTASDPDLDCTRRLYETFVDCDLEGGTVVETATTIVITGVAMGVDVNHAERCLALPCACERSQNGECDRVIATDGDGSDASTHQSAHSGLDLSMCALQLERPGNMGIAHLSGLGSNLTYDKLK